MPTKMFGVELDRLTLCGFGLFQVAIDEQQIAEIMVEIGVVRSQFDCPPGGLNGFVSTAPFAPTMNNQPPDRSGQQDCRFSRRRNPKPFLRPLPISHSNYHALSGLR